MKTDNKGLRYNKGKRDFTLIPPDALAYLADLFTMGAMKYAPRNWERGMKYSDVMASLDRHWNAFKSGEDHDGESGLYHMVHVCWNAMALLTYQLRGIGKDDRYKVRMPDTPNYETMANGPATTAPVYTGLPTTGWGRLATTPKCEMTQHLDEVFGNDTTGNPPWRPNTCTSGGDSVDRVYG